MTSRKTTSSIFHAKDDQIDPAENMDGKAQPTKSTRPPKSKTAPKGKAKAKSSPKAKAKGKSKSAPKSKGTSDEPKTKSNKKNDVGPAMYAEAKKKFFDKFLSLI